MKTDLLETPLQKRIQFVPISPLYFGISLGILTLGYGVMTIDQEAYGFGIWGLTVGPLLVLAGFVGLFFSIFKSSVQGENKAGSFSFISITGWIVFAVALSVYVTTAERTVSLWDCGEFIATAYKLQIPHPPGTPLFLLIGRFFSLFAPNKEWIAFSINLVSAVASSFTVLVLFHSIVLLGKRVRRFAAAIWISDTLLLVAASIGSLSFAFTDSFWFNATEAEVYALSCLFTALVFWVVLKWLEQDQWIEEAKWLVMLGYLIGLSAGVHLLNLLAIPALAFLYYGKKYRVTWKGGLLTLLISCGLIVFFMEGVVIGVPSLAAFFDRVLVNTFSLPFGSGVVLFVLLLVLASWYGLRLAKRKGNRNLHLAILTLVFALIGSSSIVIIPIRSAYNPPLDENDPQDAMNLMGYLKRDQYGTHPLLIGPYFTAGYPEEVKKKAPIYRKDEESGFYIIADYQYEYAYNKKHMTLFPRLYSTDPRHVKAYQEWLGLREGQKPSGKHNLKFLFECQLGHMFWRYFLWNFVGRENDVQDASWLSPFHWRETLPEVLAHNKARNNYFLLPLLLGILGIYFHARHQKQDAISIGMLFFFSGMAIVLYLNPPPIEPRERDYTYVGSYYAFSIWIGIGVFFVANLLRKVFSSPLLYTSSTALVTCAVPLVLLVQNWDDHDRRGRYFAEDSAKNVLNACEHQGILFTAADNDTFPLWYAQEAEEFRTDVRICNLSLLNMDWYVNSMKLRSNLSDPLPISFPEKNYRRGKNDMVYLREDARVEQGIHLMHYLDLLKKESPSLLLPTNEGEEVSILPSKRLFLPIDTSSFPRNQADMSTQMEFLVNGNVSKSELIVWDIIVTNGWKRPLYFDVTALSDFPYLRPYLVKEGFVYRLLPFTPRPKGQERFDSARMYENLVKKGQWRGLDDPKVYLDPASSPMIASARSEWFELAVEFYKENQLEKAKDVLLFSLDKMPDASVPFDYTILPYVELLFVLKEAKQAETVAQVLGERSLQYLDYLSVDGKKKGNDFQYHLYVLQELSEVLGKMGKEELSKRYKR